MIDNKFSSEKDRLATKEDLAKELGTIRKEIAESKADIIKWMFLFWIGQIAVTIGIIFYLIFHHKKVGLLDFFEAIN